VSELFGSRFFTQSIGRAAPSSRVLHGGRLRWRRRERRRGGYMLDVLMLAITGVFFVLAFALIRWFDRI
jgi:hypothetical protein